ncbi:hypothetical protein U1Q18_028372 [Sarracenia purpurea var. burkii]
MLLVLVGIGVVVAAVKPALVVLLGGLLLWFGVVVATVKPVVLVWCLKCFLVLCSVGCCVCSVIWWFGVVVAAVKPAVLVWCLLCCHVDAYTLETSLGATMGYGVSSLIAACCCCFRLLAWYGLFGWVPKSCSLIYHGLLATVSSADGYALGLRCCFFFGDLLLIC